MPESYPFPVYSGLLEPNHYKKIGSALWLFLWCISSTTKDSEKDGITWGIVLGNKPMKLNELSSMFGVNEKTIRRWIEILEENDYIRVTRVPYGLIFTVKNSKKYRERVDKNVQSEQPERTDMSTLSDKNVHSNKDITEDITITTIEGLSPYKQLETAYCQIHAVAEWRLKTKEVQCMQKMISGGIPVPFIIDTMQKIRQIKEDQDDINSFTYYEKPIWKAWKNRRSETEPVPSDSVTRGHSSGKVTKFRSRQAEQFEFLKKYVEANEQ